MSAKRMVPRLPTWRDMAAGDKMEPDNRRLRFLVALSFILPHLTPDEMDKIEVNIQSAIGRIGIAELMKNVDARELAR